MRYHMIMKLSVLRHGPLWLCGQYLVCKGSNFIKLNDHRIHWKHIKFCELFSVRGAHVSQKSCILQSSHCISPVEAIEPLLFPPLFLTSTMLLVARWSLVAIFSHYTLKSKNKCAFSFHFSKWRCSQIKLQWTLNGFNKERDIYTQTCT